MTLKPPVNPNSALGTGRVFWNVQSDFGARGNGTTDDTAAIQAACTAGAGGVVFFPSGTYLVSSAITVPASTTLTGSGAGTTPATKITTASATQVIFSCSSLGVKVEDIYFLCTHATPTSSAALEFGTVSESNIGARVSDCRIEGFWNGINFVAGYYWVVRHSFIYNSRNFGIYVRNTNNSDVGDATIIGCFIDNTNGTGASAIRYESGGGLKLVGNKLIHHAVGFDLRVADGANTVDCQLTGNSVENQTTVPVQFRRLGTTGNFSNIAVAGNQIFGEVDVYDGISSVTITGNTFTGAGSGTGIGIQGGTSTVIVGNIFRSYLTGIFRVTGNNGVRIGPNHYVSVTVPIEDQASLGDTVGLTEQAYKRTINAVSSSVTYTNYYRLDFANYRGCSLDITIEGIVNGVAGFSRLIRKIVSHDTGACTVTAVSDTAAGAVIDVQFDTATTAGSVYIGVRRNAAGGGTDVTGAITCRVDGTPQKVQQV